MMNIIVRILSAVALALILFGATAWLIFGAGWARVPMYLGIFISCALCVPKVLSDRKKKKK